MKEYNNKEFRSVPAWVRKLAEDIYGVNPESPTFIQDYKFDKPIQLKLQELLSYIPVYQDLSHFNDRIAKVLIERTAQVNDFLLDAEGQLYTVTAIDSEYYYIKYVADLKGPIGNMLTIHGGLYDENNPLPAFADADYGGYVFKDTEGLYDLHLKNAGAIDWVIIDNWAGVPGPQGIQGPKGSYILTTTSDYVGTQYSISDLNKPSIARLYDVVVFNNGFMGQINSITTTLYTVENVVNLKGPKGDTGETGPIGPQGTKGHKGDTGDGVLKYFNISDFSKYNTNTNDLFSLNNFDNNDLYKRVMLVFVGFNTNLLQQQQKTYFTINNGSLILVNPNRNLTIIRSGYGPYKFVFKYFTLENEMILTDIQTEEASINISFQGGEYRAIVL